MTSSDPQETLPNNVPADGAQASTPNDANMNTALEAAKKEAAANYDRYVRTVADLDNYRRRAQREKDETRQYAVSSALEDLIPVIDNLGLSLSAARQQTDPKVLLDGVAMIAEQLKNALAKHGLKEINPAGQKFDPNFHESIAHQPSGTVPEGHVVQVVRAGYSLNNRLLRPASVIVSSGAAKEEAKT